MAKIVKMDMDLVPIGVRLPLYAEYSEIDAEVIELIKFARQQRTSVTYMLIKAQVRKGAESAGKKI